MRNAIICDIDGTLCDASDRIKYVQNKPKNYQKFYDEAIHSKANDWCKLILSGLPKSVEIILLTGRPYDNAEDLTTWLVMWGVRWNKIFMRNDGDYRQDAIIKQEIFDKEIKGKYKVLFCLDDRQQVVDMWRSNKLVCLQCSNGKF